MADKLIGADALTRAIVNSPSDISGYNPVYCNGVAKRQIEILDIMLNMNGTTEGEIRAKAIDEFAEIMKERLKGMQMVELQGEDVCPCAKTGEECPYINQDIGCQFCAREQTIKDIDEIAEYLKGGATDED